MKNVIVVDGNSLIFKAYFATAYSGVIMQTANKEYTNALYAFINMMNKIQNEMPHDYLLVAFDASKKNFRHDQFKEYKGTRSKAPEELVMQFSYIREYLDLLCIPNYEIDGYEADDIIGTLATLCDEQDYHLDIISSDKDMLQLVSKNVDVLLAIKGISNINRVNIDNFSEIWDITPPQVIDLKGLMGDASDNIPGVKGVGEKTALKLLSEYQSVEGIYENIASIKGKLQEKLINDEANAIMSKQLATIIRDIDLPFTIDELVVSQCNVAKVKDFYHRFELTSLLNKMQAEHKNEVQDFTYEVVDTIPEEVLVKDNFIDLISLNETYHQDMILGLAIINNDKAYFIKISSLMKDEKTLAYLESDLPKTCYDIKKNKVLAHWHNIKLNNLVDDVMISTYLIDCNVKLDPFVLVDTNFNITSKSNKDLLKLEEVIQIEEKVKQTYYLSKLVASNQKTINELSFENLYNVELDIANILCEMELNGLLVNEQVIKDLQLAFDTKVKELENSIYGFANKTFNINSFKQLGEVLFEDLNLPIVKKTKTGYSTDNNVLQFLEDKHPIINLIIEYRTYTKLLSTYISPMPAYIMSDNRVHTIYNQCLTATGRLSSKEPNLQNTATRSELQKSIKKMFIAPKGYQLVSFDYSQIELRVIASFSSDPVFKKAFEEDEDIHVVTAAHANGITEDQVTPAQRKAAKAINFGIVYGISDFGLAVQLNILRGEAKTFIENYYETYPSIKAYLDGLIEECLTNGYSTTILGRRRVINEITSNNFNIKENGKRMAMNTPIQGSAADILKLAMIKVAKQLKASTLDAKMLLQVHDELIFEVKKEDVEELVKLVTKEMESAYPLDVKLVVNSSSGDSWYNL